MIFAYYELVLAACVVIAVDSYFMSGWQAPYHLSGWSFVLLGMLVPAYGLIFQDYAFLLTPLSLGILYVQGRGYLSVSRRMRRERWAGILGNAEDSIKKDPNNAYAYCLRAQYFEAKGAWERAFEDYKKAASLETRAYTTEAFIQDELRLKRQIESERSRRKSAQKLIASLDLWPPPGWLLGLIVLSPLLWEPPYFVVDYSMWLFAGWCMRWRPQT